MPPSSRSTLLDSSDSRPRTGTPPPLQLDGQKLGRTPASAKAHSMAQYHSGSPARATASGNDNHHQWAKDVRKAHVHDSCEVSDWLKNYVPSSINLSADSGGDKENSVKAKSSSRRLLKPNPFEGIPVKANHESDMYIPLVRGFNDMLTDVPEKNRIRFAITSKHKFEPLEVTEHNTFPDILGTFPGDELPSKWGWPSSSIVAEVKPKDTDDPIDAAGKCKVSQDASGTLVQLAKNGRNLLWEHRMCFAFVIGIYGNQMRFFRFDHKKVISSKSFNYIEDHHLVREFLVRFSHPMHQVPKTVVGFDHTITIPTNDELDAMIPLVRRLCPQIDTNVIRKTGRWVAVGINDSAFRPGGEVPPNEIVQPGSSQGKGKGRQEREQDQDTQGTTIPKTRCFTFGKPLYWSLGLFSRATFVSRALIQGHTDKVYVLKDSWRQKFRIPEIEVYRLIKTRIQKFLEPQERPGIPSCVGYTNLGECYPPEHGHTTVTVGDDMSLSKYQRDHDRLLTDLVGENLSTFANTRQLIGALRRAIRAHQLLFRCGILHRDISPGNVLLAEDEDLGGFIHDFDYSTILTPGGGDQQSIEEVDKELKDLTGTLQFIAHELLSDESISHKPRHDVESFYWLLVYLLLRHTDHGGGDDACSKLFDHSDPGVLADLRYAWLGDKRKRLPISNNGPLTDLLEKLKQQFRKQIVDYDIDSVDHDAVLEIFDASLAMPGWPSHDKSLKYVLKQRHMSFRNEGSTLSKEISASSTKAVAEKQGSESAKRKRGRTLVNTSRKRRTGERQQASASLSDNSEVEDGAYVVSN